MPIISFIMSCFGSNSPLKTIAVTVAATLLLSATGVVAYKLITDAKKITSLSNQVQKVTAVAKDLNKTVIDTQKSVAITADAEKTQESNEAAIVSKHETVKANTAAKVKEITENKDIPIEVKEEDLSKIYIASVWSEYCNSNENNECNNVLIKQQIGTADESKS